MKPEISPRLAMIAKRFSRGDFGWQKRETGDIMAVESYLRDRRWISSTENFGRRGRRAL